MSARIPLKDLAEAVARGDFDEHLGGLFRLLRDREAAIRAQRSAAMAATLKMGDRVRFREETRPRHLALAQGTVQEVRAGGRVAVLLDADSPSSWAGKVVKGHASSVAPIKDEPPKANVRVAVPDAVRTVVVWKDEGGEGPATIYIPPKDGGPAWAGEKVNEAAIGWITKAAARKIAKLGGHGFEEA